jgi:hypothetical protein
MTVMNRHTRAALGSAVAAGVIAASAFALTSGQDEAAGRSAARAADRATGHTASEAAGKPAGSGSGIGTRSGQQQSNIRYIVNKHSGRCLTVRDASSADNAQVNQYRCVGAKNQQWRLEFGGGDPSVAAITLRNVNSGKCLTVHGGVRKGASVDQYRCLAQPNQTFSFLPSFPDRTPLYTKPLTSKKLALDVQGAATGDNAPVIVWNFKHRTNQEWNIERSA